MILAIACAGSCLLTTILSGVVSISLLITGVLPVPWLLFTLGLTWLSGVGFVLSMQWLQEEREERAIIKEMEKEFEDDNTL